MTWKHKSTVNIIKLTSSKYFSLAGLANNIFWESPLYRYSIFF